ncbi:hypothetical protein BX600DRAFT_435638 [Xylariales sp. PMI_506]|nr:hypothetical protein BX600DRAFT_435638 [Xylariales sp. PMI_506]
MRVTLLGTIALCAGLTDATNCQRVSSNDEIGSTAISAMYSSPLELSSISSSIVISTAINTNTSTATSSSTTVSPFTVISTTTSPSETTSTTIPTSTVDSSTAFSAPETDSSATSIGSSSLSVEGSSSTGLTTDADGTTTTDAANNTTTDEISTTTTDTTSTATTDVTGTITADETGTITPDRTGTTTADETSTIATGATSITTTDVTSTTTTDVTSTATADETSTINTDVTGTTTTDATSTINSAASSSSSVCYEPITCTTGTNVVTSPTETYTFSSASGTAAVELVDLVPGVKYGVTFKTIVTTISLISSGTPCIMTASIDGVNITQLAVDYSLVSFNYLESQCSTGQVAPAGIYEATSNTTTLSLIKWCPWGAGDKTNVYSVQVVPLCDNEHTGAPPYVCDPYGVPGNLVKNPSFAGYNPLYSSPFPHWTSDQSAYNWTQASCRGRTVATDPTDQAMFMFGINTTMTQEITGLDTSLSYNFSMWTQSVQNGPYCVIYAYLDDILIVSEQISAAPVPWTQYSNVVIPTANQQTLRLVQRCNINTMTLSSGKLQGGTIDVSIVDDISLTPIVADPVGSKRHLRYTTSSIY